MFASWLVIGAGMGTGLYEAAFSTLAGIYGQEARRSITGITLIAGFASTVCWPISAYLDVTIGWRATCYVWAAAHVALGLPINLLLPRPRRAEQSGQSQARASSGRGRLAMMAGLAFVFAATWFCSTAMAAHLPRLLQESGASLAAAVAVCLPLAAQDKEPPQFEMAGPRREIRFDPKGLRCGIVTCGGLCPGLNDVIRAVVLALHYQYGVTGTVGFRYGYEGLTGRHEPMVFTVEYGKGRVLHTPMGHGIDSQECVGFITTFQRGAEWAATGKVTTKIPSDFPTAEKTSSRKSQE